MITYISKYVANNEWQTMHIKLEVTTARKWSQPSCSSVYECIMKIWYVNKIEYYSALKKNAIKIYRKMDEFRDILSEVTKLEMKVTACLDSDEKG